MQYHFVVLDSYFVLEKYYFSLGATVDHQNYLMNGKNNDLLLDAIGFLGLIVNGGQQCLVRGFGGQLAARPTKTSAPLSRPKDLEPKNLCSSQG